MRIGNITLRDYQQDAINRVRESLRRNKRVILQSGTGSGKTAMGLYMMHSAVSRGRRAMFIVHQRELLAQTEAAFWTQGLTHGVVSPNRRPSALPAQLAMIQTLANRVENGRVPPPDLIVIDECHRSLSPTYTSVAAAFPDATIVGLSATPERTDGRGMGELYEDIIPGPSYRYLIDRGHLCDYQIFAPSIAAASAGDNVSRRGGEYNLVQLAEAMKERKIYGDAVAHYRRLTPGKRVVVMCPSVARAEDAAEAYRAAGVPAVSIDGSMTDAERQQIIRDFTSGELLCVTTVQLLIEGVDIPGIEVVQWLRHTDSPIVWGQGNGRGFRPHPGKKLLTILDHVGNFTRQGLPCDEREYSLHGRSKRKRSGGEVIVDDGPAVTSCGPCFRIYPAGLAACPYCGAPNADKQRREAEHVAAELERIEIAKAAQARLDLRRRQGQAKDLASLIRLYVSHGSGHPDKRAVKVIAGRERREATGEDYAEARQILRELRGESVPEGLL